MMEAFSRLLPDYSSSSSSSSSSEGRLDSSAVSRQKSTSQHRTSSNCCRTTSSALILYGAPRRHARLLWLFVLAIGILSQATSSTAQQQDTAISVNSSSTTQAATTQAESVTVFLDPNIGAPVLNARECRQMFDTFDQVIYICRDHPDMVPLLKYAESVAKDECQKQFKDELWNCSDFSLLKTPKINKGASVYREGAYIDALSIAAITHTIAKACGEGLLKSCACDNDAVDLPSSNDVEYTQGCSDNVDYGLMVAERFLNKRFTSVGRDLKHELAQHNFRAAKEAIKKIITETPVICTCHGISGSCTFQTCHSKLPEFEVLGNALRKRYDDACEVRANGRSENAWISECSRDFTNSDLLYRNEYNWCVADSSIGAPGVVGRRCDPNTTGTGSCQSLCRSCGRVPRQREEERRTQCRCSFFFCCEIRCSTCVEHRTFYECA